MKKYSLEITPRFEKDIKRYKKKHYDLGVLYEVIDLLINGQSDILVRKYRDHKLSGEWNGFRELPLGNDGLLVYMIREDKLILTLTRMGSHDDLGLID